MWIDLYLDIDWENYFHLLILILIKHVHFQVRLQLWDTAGQERFRRSMVAHYYRNVSAVVLVYDVTRKDTFNALEHWIAVRINQNGKLQEFALTTFFAKIS